MRRSVPSSQQSDRSSTPGGTSTAVVKAVIASKTSGTLNLSGRDLVELPACVYDDEQLPAGADSKWWEVTELSKLDLSRNQLKALPDRLGALSTLTHLDVSHNALQGLFSSLPTLDGLKLLNLEANRLIGLPDAVASLPHLVVLQVGDNRLRHLPDRLGYEQKILATVLCQKNTLEELPKGLAYCKSLTKLDATSNRLTHLPAELLQPGGMSESLLELTLCTNQLRALPYEIGMLRRLRVLMLKENRISELPPTIGSCVSLTELYVGFNALTTLPDEIAGCQALKTLDVRNNRITELRPSIGSLNLSLLDVQNNELRTLPPELCRMTTLRALPLEGNPLRSIRPEVARGPISGLMKYLESRLPGACDAGGHAGGARAGNVFGLDEAELAADAARKIALGGVAAQRNAAHMAGVPVPGGGGSSGGAGATGGLGYHSAGAVSIAGAPPRRGLPSRGAPPSRSAAPPGSGAGDGFSGGGSAVHLPEFGTGGAAGGSGGGKELSLRNARLTQLPPDLWAAAPFLGKLDLSGNHLASLPPAALGAFQTVFTLSINNAGLTQWPLPWQPGSMPNLQHLIMSMNRDLRSMPPSALTALPDLYTLELAGTPAGAALLRPGALAPATNLTSLDLSNTQLGGFPPDVAVLPKLRILKLSGNKIVAVPEEIGRTCVRLEELDLSNNELNTLSPYMGMLPALRSLILDGNPLRTIRRPILDKGTAYLLQYLRDRIPA